MMVNSTTSTSISLSWDSSGPEMDGYVVTWKRNTPLECPGRDKVDMNMDKSSTSYIIMGLEEYSRYTITVAAVNAAGSVVGDPITGMTKESGERILM